MLALIGIFVISSHFVSGDQNSVPVPNMDFQKIKQNLTRYQSNLLNEDSLPFLKKCYDKSCCTGSQVLCPSYFELVRLFNQNNIIVNATDQQQLFYEVEKSTIQNTDEFCRSLASRIPKSTVYKSQQKQSEIVDLIVDLNNCKLICVDLVWNQSIGKTSYSYTIKPLCKFISWMSEMLSRMKTVIKTTKVPLSINMKSSNVNTVESTKALNNIKVDSVSANKPVSDNKISTKQKSNSTPKLVANNETENNKVSNTQKAEILEDKTTKKSQNQSGEREIPVENQKPKQTQEKKDQPEKQPERQQEQNQQQESQQKLNQQQQEEQPKGEQQSTQQQSEKNQQEKQKQKEKQQSIQQQSEQEQQEQQKQKEKQQSIQQQSEQEQQEQQKQNEEQQSIQQQSEKDQLQQQQKLKEEKPNTQQQDQLQSQKDQLAEISNDIDGSQGDTKDLEYNDEAEDDDESTISDLLKTNLNKIETIKDNLNPEPDQILSSLSGSYGKGESINSNNVNMISTDPFYEESGSNFFIYFLIMMFVCMISYVLYHNKTKILALLIEGRRHQTKGKTRRKHTAGYRKLDTNLEEAITSTSSGQVTQIIY